MSEPFSDIIDFWYGSGHADKTDAAIASGQGELWWKKQQSTDDLIRERFGDLVKEAVDGGLADWSESPTGDLARIILLDQFTRNIYRGDGVCYAGDSFAQAAVQAGMDAGRADALRPVYRVTYFMPLMHAESRPLQNKAVALFEALATSMPEEQRAPFENFADYARQHRDIVERFGRFPHRNVLLDRDSTAEEVEFLEQPGSSF